MGGGAGGLSAEPAELARDGTGVGRAEPGSCNPEESSVNHASHQHTHVTYQMRAALADRLAFGGCAL